MTRIACRAVCRAACRVVCLVLVLGHAANLGADELKVWTARALATVLAEVGSEFERTTGHKLVVTSDLPAGFARRAAAGESFDVLISTSATVDDWLKDGRLIAASRRDVARSGIGVEVRAGAPRPDISSVEAFKRTLLEAKSIAYLRVGSGIYVAGLLDRLGLTAALQGKVTRPEGDVVSELVAGGEIELGIVVITQILTTPGVQLVGPLPPEIQSSVTFASGISTRSTVPDAAKALMAFLAGPTALPVIRKQGMEPAVAAAAPEPIPDRLVVLTLDDSKASHYAVVRPLLKKYGFGATFFITEGFTFRTNKDDYLTWEQIAELHRDGFEIGNHTRDHMGLTKANLPKLKEQVDAIAAQCAAHGIPAPTSFAYPGNAIDPEALGMLAHLGFRFARRGGAPEYPYEEGNGFAYEPGRDHPLLLPSAGDARPVWTLDNLKRAVSQAVKGRIAILQFHGAPDVEHPWVHTPPERFAEYMKYLHDEGYKVIALRDLAKYVDWTQAPADAWRVIEERKGAAKQGRGAK